MSKVISFEPRVGKVQTGQTSGGFTAIKPKEKEKEKKETCGWKKKV